MPRSMMGTSVRMVLCGLLVVGLTCNPARAQSREGAPDLVSLRAVSRALPPLAPVHAAQPTAATATDSHPVRTGLVLGLVAGFIVGNVVLDKSNSGCAAHRDCSSTAAMAVPSYMFGGAIAGACLGWALKK